MSSDDFPNDGFDEVEYPAEERFPSEFPANAPDAEADDAVQIEEVNFVPLDLESMTVPQLKQHAADWGIDLKGAKKHGEIIRVIQRELEQPESDGQPVDDLVDNAFDLSSLYEHMPPTFTEKLTNALHARGLVEPGDYFKAGAAQLFRSAMLGVIKKDFLSAQALAKKVWVDNAGRKR